MWIFIQFTQVVHTSVCCCFCIRYIGIYNKKQIKYVNSYDEVGWIQSCDDFNLIKVKLICLSKGSYHSVN